ncbi:unnamed protein product [Urochloa humidicola]
MGRLFLMHLEGNVYSCKHCKTHLGLAGDIISKAFHCKHGKAYLFHKVVNVTPGVKEDRMMMTGMHTVSDIFCVGCGAIVGWKYRHMRRARGTRKESIFWRGLRCQALMEASTGLHMMLIWLEVIPTMYEERFAKLKHVVHPL